MMNENVIVEYLKNVGKPVSKKEIVDATNFDGDFRAAINKLRRIHPEIETSGTTTTTKYCWKSESKNPEGYSDPTADRAVKNVLRNSNGSYPMRQSFGEVWSTSAVNEDMEGLLVVSANDGTCICYNVYPSKKGYMKDHWTFKWSTDEGLHYIYAMNPINIAERKLGKKLYELEDNEKEELRSFVTAAMNVSSIVETKIYVKDESADKLSKENIKLKDRIEELQEKIASILIPEASTIDPRDLELAVLRAKLEVYEKVIDVWKK